jgi:hypothetical protein
MARRCATFQFASIDPERPAAAGLSRRSGRERSGAISDRARGTWQAQLAVCWRRVAARSARALARSDEHELLAYAGATLHMVEHTLIELGRDLSARPGCEPRSALWSAAQALDASAVVWHRFEPSAGRRFGVLGRRLQERIGEPRAPQPSAALIAAASRRGVLALDRLAIGEEPRHPALADLEDATLTLAAIGVALRGESDTAARSDPGAAPNAVALHRLAEEVARLAGARARCAIAAHHAAGEWLALALAAGPPADLSVIDDPVADRVLRADALSGVRAAWVARAALELVAARRLLGVSRLSARRPRTPPHRIAATRAATRSHATAPAEAESAWRAHTLGLARAAGSYVRACADSDGRFAPAREELVDLLADSLLQAARLDARLGGAGTGGAHVLRR